MAEQSQQTEIVSIDDIGLGVEPNAGWVIPDPKTTAEIEDLNAQQKDAILERYRQTTRQRQRFSYLIYGLVVGWIILVFFVLMAQGFGWFSRPLADGVLMWLVGGSTGSILGILWCVISNLFPTGKSN